MLNQVHHLFFYSLEAQNDFYIFPWLKKLKEYFMTCEHYTKFKFQAYSFFWNTAIFLHLCIVWGCSPPTMAELSEFHRGCVAPKYLLSGPFLKAILAMEGSGWKRKIVGGGIEGWFCGCIFKRTLWLPCGKYSVGNRTWLYYTILCLYYTILFYGNNVYSSKTFNGVDKYFREWAEVFGLFSSQ